MSDTVLVDTAGGVATITLNRPDGMNALTLEAKEALLAAVSSAAPRTCGCVAMCCLYPIRSV